VRLCDTTFSVTVWDACHRDHPEFPEVRAGREFERREALYARALPRAVAVIVDSGRLGARVGQLYGVDPERIVVLPYKPSPILREAAASGNAAANPQWGFAEPYVLYPAQFWAHKNHVYILESLATLKREHGLVVHAVFCGGDRGNGRAVEARARRLGVQDQMHLLGFVSPGELVHLYRNALALLMPTYFGPTNIPPLEAFGLGCPVVVSDIASFRESYGDGALYCDLGDPRSLAAHVRALHESADLRQRLAARGASVLAAIGETDYRAKLAGPLRTFRQKRRAFRNG
jgi:glycosyltransferase involved in cell wall biosynthesis